MRETEESLLDYRTLISPEQPAILYDGLVITYKELYNMKTRIMHLLHYNQVKKGEKIGIILPNTPDFIAVMFAIMNSGCIFVPINTRLTRNELFSLLQEVEIKHVVATKNHRYLEKEGISVTIVNNTSHHSMDHPLDEVSTTRTDTACIVPTSGTTGSPKFVPLSYHNIITSVLTSTIRLGHLPQDRWLLVLPLYHLGGLAIVFRSIVQGIPMIIMENFDETLVLTSIKQYQVTIISLVPTMLQRLIDADTEQILSTLRIILLGGGAATGDLLKICNEKNLPVALTYGMTETASQFATAVPGFQKEKLGSVGKPLLFNKFKILDENGDQLSSNQIGRLYISSPTLMDGYLGTDRKENFDGDYFSTGDIGYADEDGDLFILQRRTDLIISGGENIYPREVERLLDQMSEISEAVVIPIDDEEWGQKPIAIVRLKNIVTKDSIDEYLQNRLSSFKRPKEYYIIDKYPVTSIGKIKRGELQEMVDSGQLTPLE